MNRIQRTLFPFGPACHEPTSHPAQIITFWLMHQESKPKGIGLRIVRRLRAHGLGSEALNSSRSTVVGDEEPQRVRLLRDNKRGRAVNVSRA